MRRDRGRESLQKRILLLPLIWGAYGIGEVLALPLIFGPVVANVPYAPGDKPISGSYLPALAFNVLALLAMLGFSLYALGIWNIDLSSPKLKRDLTALAILLASLGLVFYYPILVFPAVVALIYLLATNIE
jgi:hypothetical protein